MTSLPEHIAALAALPDLAPLVRAARAAQLIEEAKTVLSTERAVAIAQARDAGASRADIGRALGISGQAVGKTDRILLQAALRILVAPGVSTALTDQLLPGLRSDAPLTAVARRVVFGARHLHRAALSAPQRQLIDQAVTRANALLREDPPPDEP